MTVYSKTNKITYVGDVSQVLYPIPFEYIDPEEIIVSIYDKDNNFIEEWDNTVQFNIDNNNVRVLEGYQIDNTKKMLVKRVVEAVQDNKYREGGDFPAKSTETSLDKATMLIQQVNEEVERTPKLDPIYNVDLTLPAPQPRKALVWNEAGDGFDNSTVDFDQVEAETKKFRDEAEQFAIDSEASAVRSEASAVRSETAAQSAADTVAGFDQHAEEVKNNFDINAATLTAKYDNNALAKTNDFNANAQAMTDGYNQNAMLKIDDFDAHAMTKEIEFDDNAATKQAQVDASAAKAMESETNAKASEVAAKASEDNAKNSENAAGISEDNARESERLAREYKEAAAKAATNAKTSETNSSTSESKASTSEQNAANSESIASQAATNANLSAEASKTSETNAKDSETKAKASEDKCIELVNSLQNVYKFKGSVPTKADLPTTGNTTGDVWNVLDSDINYAWDGTAWDALGGASTDLSDYVTKDLGMLLARDEEVSSSKTFMKDQAIKSPDLDIRTDRSKRGNGLIFTDKNGTQTAGIGVYVNNNQSPECRLVASNGTQSAFAGLGVTTDGQGFFEVPTPSADSNNRDAVNSEWIKPKLDALQADINGKQPTGNYQTVANLSQTLDTSTSKYPSNKAVKDAIANIDLSTRADTNLSNITQAGKNVIKANVDLTPYATNAKVDALPKHEVVSVLPVNPDPNTYYYIPE